MTGQRLAALLSSLPLKRSTGWIVVLGAIGYFLRQLAEIVRELATLEELATPHVVADVVSAFGLVVLAVAGAFLVMVGNRQRATGRVTADDLGEIATGVDWKRWTR